MTTYRTSILAEATIPTALASGRKLTITITLSKSEFNFGTDQWLPDGKIRETITASVDGVANLLEGLYRAGDKLTNGQQGFLLTPDGLAALGTAQATVLANAEYQAQITAERNAKQVNAEYRAHELRVEAAL